MFRHRVAIPSSLVRVTLLPAPTGGLDRHCLDIDAPSTPERLGLARVQSARPMGATGWAADPNAWPTVPSAPTLPIAVHIYIDGVGYVTTANVSRPDVGAAYPGYGNNHGFDAVVPVPAGIHELCLYAINSGPGTNIGIGCKMVLVNAYAPTGSIDSAVAASGGIRIQGWALDLNTVAAININITVDGATRPSVLANVSRPDVGAYFPGFGNNHGFDTVVTTTTGSHQVCVWANNDLPAGPDVQLGCRTVTA